MAPTTDPNGWRIHRTGTSGGVILAVDFSITGRGEACFSDLAPNLATSHALWETEPEQRTSGPISGRAEIERWLPAVRDSGLEVVALTSFCAGAAFLDDLLDGIRQFRPDARPKIVMFDPEVPAALTLYYIHARALARFEGIFPAEALAAHQAEAKADYDAADGDITVLVDKVVDQFRRVSSEGFRLAGIDAKYGDGLCDAFIHFSRYLVAGAQLKTRAVWPTGISITSRTTTNGLHRLSPEDRAVAVAEEIVVDVEHVELLGHPEVAALTDRLLPDLRAHAAA